MAEQQVLGSDRRPLPASKEVTIDLYRSGLEACGVTTDPWWERQLARCLLGAMAQFGWEKALDGVGDELAWWQEHVVAAAPLLAR